MICCEKCHDLKHFTDLNSNNICINCEENDPDYGRRFRKHFPSNKITTVASEFIKVIRDGEKDLRSIINQVIKNTLPTSRYDGKAYIADMIKNYPDEAMEYAEYYLEWEALSDEERERIRRQKGAEYIKQHMEKQAATEKQIRYLTGVLEYKGTLPINKAEASNLINKILIQKGWASCDG